jgi:hypothetical protein
MYALGEADTSRWTAYLRELAGNLSGTATLTVVPSPDVRREGGSNSAVLASLAARNPALLAPGPDLFEGGELPEAWTLQAVAKARLRGAGRALAARLRSGAFVQSRKQSGTPGVDTGQLADSLDNATVIAE